MDFYVNGIHKEIMKKINSINYGGKIICVGMIIMLVIPGMLMLMKSGV